jgi:hypothetical protein
MTTIEEATAAPDLYSSGDPRHWRIHDGQIGTDLLGEQYEVRVTITGCEATINIHEADGVNSPELSLTVDAAKRLIGILQQAIPLIESVPTTRWESRS